MTTNRRLLAYVWICEDVCRCQQPVIEEIWTDAVGVEHTERFFEGTWLSDPSPSEEEMLRDELEEACRRHGLERDSFDLTVWEKELT